jgi:hypothetical protein
MASFLIRTTGVVGLRHEPAAALAQQYDFSIGIIPRCFDAEVFHKTRLEA